MAKITLIGMEIHGVILLPFINAIQAITFQTIRTAQIIHTTITIRVTAWDVSAVRPDTIVKIQVSKS